jgi:hypothetical protein
MEKDTPHYLYFLYDPTYISQMIYAGVSYQPYKRYKGHLENKRENKDKLKWIDELAIRGVKPEIKLFHLFSNEELAYSAEVEVIAVCRKIGISLCNIADGGNKPPTKHGEGNGWAKLKQWQVDEMRMLYLEEKCTIKQLSEKYKGITSTTNICGVVHYKSWVGDSAPSNELLERLALRKEEDIRKNAQWRSENIKGINSPSYGKSVKQETKDKLSKANKGRKIEDTSKIKAGILDQWNSDKGKRRKENYSLMLRDEGSHSAILNEQLVLAIRDEYKNTKTNYKELAQKYGVKKSTISDIIKYRTWKHI